jgi:hypothetical protein
MYDEDAVVCNFAMSAPLQPSSNNEVHIKLIHIFFTGSVREICFNFCFCFAVRTHSPRPTQAATCYMWFSKPLTIKVEGDTMTLEYLRYRTELNRSTRLVSVQKEYPCSSSICPCWHSAVEMQDVVAFVYIDSKPVAKHSGDDRNQRQPRHQNGGRLLIINKSQVHH